jgi:hypothetical protein
MHASRRTFMKLAAGTIAGAAVTATPGTAAAARATTSAANGPASSGSVLPRFPQPLHLDVVDITSASGADQALLTTLQGIVNRRRPRIWTSLATDGTDKTWLDTLRIPRSNIADPLSLVDRYRHEISGAIVYDIDMPDSVNVATTLAGLRGAVIADADQAKSLGLRVVEDLRGKFSDTIEAYTWQLENLWPLCNHSMLTGIGGTQTVPVPGVTWATVGKVTQPVTDGSNKGTFTFDLTAQLGGDAVYLRFQDAYSNDGWGPSVQQVTLKADGKTIASFQPTTDAELPYLFDVDGSSKADGGWRFADGGSYWIYKFDPPAGAKALSVDVLMWNEYLVTATDTAPTHVVPFPNFRDYIVANRAMVSWLEPDIPDQADLMNQIFAKVKPTTPYLGWFPGGVSGGEWGGVGYASQHGIEVLAADFFNNATVLSGTRDRIVPRRRSIPPATLQNKVYVTLTVMEGDNVQYDEHRLRQIWDHADRGKVPTNWTIDPLLADFAPAMFSYYQRTASANDLLIAGPSGGAYTYPGAWPADEIDDFTRMTGDYLRRTGIDVIHVFNNIQGNWTPLTDAIGASYQRNTDALGVILAWETGSTVSTPGGLPVVTDYSPGGQPADYLAGLKNKIADWDGTKPMFIACQIPAWVWTPAEITQLAGLLDDPFRIVRGDTFFSLIRQTTG